MSAGGEDKENVDGELQDKHEDRQNEEKAKGKRKKDKKEKNKTDPARFQGAGINFKAKLIGIESVPEARGDKMCQEAMQNLKAIVKAAGEHKQRIIINVSLEGLKILDDKSGTIIHHHAVHKISFISRDATDGRAFGYVYGLGEGKHDFFGIKTEKPAEGLVLALRDLFQTVFEIKKREVELQKQKQREEEERKKEEEGKSETNSQGKNGSNYDDSADKVEENGNLFDLVDLESELSNLQQGIAQMNAFATSEDFFASGPDTPISPPVGGGSGPMFPVSFDSPASPPASAGFTAIFPSLQSDPFQTSSVSQSIVDQNNMFGQDVFAPLPQPAVSKTGFADFHSLPGSGPTSSSASPQPPRAQSSFSGLPLTQDPFKNDPFFTSSQPASTQLSQPATSQMSAADKYAALAMLDTSSDRSSPQAVGSSEWNGNFSSAFSQTSQPVMSSGWPGVTSTPLQPLSTSSNQSPQQTPSPAKVSDPFASLDSIGGTKPHVDKSDFFKRSSSPSLAQISKTPSTDLFGSTGVSDPFASAPFVHTSDKENKELDPFDTSSVLQPVQRGPYDTSQLKPQPFESPPIVKKQSNVKENNEEDEKFDFDLPSPTAPPPPLPAHGAVALTDIAPAPPPRPRPKLMKAQTIDIPDLPPPAIPPRPSSRPALNSSSLSRTTISTWFDKADLCESPKRTPSPSRHFSASSSLPQAHGSCTPPPSNQTLPIMRHTPPLTRGMSTPSPSLSYTSANRSPIAISRPRPRPRPHTPGSSSTGTPSTLEQLPEATPADSFSRDIQTRQSDKLDDHVAARRIAASKSLVRNQSDPYIVPPTEDSALPVKEIFGSDPAVGKQPPDSDQLSDVSSVDRQSYSSSFKDSFKLDPFANTDKGPVDPFAVESPPDPFSNSFCGDQNELFQTKAVVCENEEDLFENDPFGSDPFGNDVFGSCAVSTGSSEHTSEHFPGDTGRPGSYSRPESAGRPGSASHMVSDNKDAFSGPQGSPGMHSAKHSASSTGPPSPSLFSSKLSGSSAGASDQGFFSDPGRGFTTSRESTQDSFGQDYVSINWGDAADSGSHTTGPGEATTDPDPFSTDFVKNQPILGKKTTVEQLKRESSPAHSRPPSVERPSSASSIDPNDFFPARQGDPFAAVAPLSRQFGTPPAHQPKAVFQWSHSSSPPVYGGSESPRPDWPVPIMPTDPYMAGQNGQPPLPPSSEPMGHPAMAGMQHGGMPMSNGGMRAAPLAPQYPQMYGGPMTPPPHMPQVPPRHQGSPSIPPQQPPVSNPFYTNQWPQ